MLWDDFLVSASRDWTIGLWNKDGKCIRILKECASITNCLIVWENFLVSGSNDGNVTLWDRRGTHIQTLKGDDSPIMDLSIYNGLLMARSQDDEIVLWNKNRERVQTQVDCGGNKSLTSWGDFLVGTPSGNSHHGRCANVIKIWG